MKLLILLMMIPFAAVAGFDGAGAPGGQQAGGAPMADKDGDLGWQEGKPSAAGGAAPAASDGCQGSKGQGGQGGKGGKGRGDGSGPWGSKGAMGGQSGKQLK